MKVLVIGCGSIGFKHVKNLISHFNFEIAVHDTDKNINNELSELKIVQFFDDLDTALSWGADAAIIATPNMSHIRYANKLLDSNIPCLIEKPISNDYDEANLFIRNADNKNYPVFVACNMRYHQGPSTLKENINRIGEIIFVDAYFSHYLPYMRPGIDYRDTYFNDPKQGGVVFDCIHEIDYVTWIAGKVDKINSAYFSKISNLELKTEDFANFSLSHNDNITSHIHLDYISRYKKRGCTIVGTNGDLIWESQGKSSEKCVVKYCHNDTGEDVIFETNEVNSNQAYIDMLKDFIKTVKGEKSKKLLRGDEALEVLNTAVKIKEYPSQMITA